MQLKDIVSRLQPTKTEGSLEREVVGITYDSRRVTPGMVFVAIPGQNTDGHDFISSAIDRGAAAIICERNGFSSQRAAKIKVNSAREALARASAAFYGNPSTKLKMIGVTGTNGKTTVSFMVKHILETAGIRTGLIGTVRYEIGERMIPAHRTTPEALEIQQMLASMLRSDCQACVMEVSSHALDQSRVSGIDFDVAIFTNLTQDHLDYHGTLDAYYTAKRKLFTGFESSSKQGASVINIDDSYGGKLTGESDAEVQYTYGVSPAARLKAVHIQLERTGTKFDVEIGERKVAVRIPLIGRHNVYNALAAIGAALSLKVEIDDIVLALGSLPLVPGRLEAVDNGQPFGVYVDYAHTDDALQNVLTTLREITRGRLLLLFGCGGSRDTGKRAKMGAVAAQLADYTFITSDNPRKEKPSAIAAQIEEGFRSVRQDQYVVELDRHAAIDEIIRMAKPGDMVLIAGKGHETYQEFEDTVVPFDDRVYAQEALELVGWKTRNASGEDDR
ncbi:MAG TPA: UDP-N-acetylmuramoyl-L-alanyl-D-glutamate--2,6-diaminopimelate ligase [Roseimicrobium sp.]|nr:UDP-N-acetylmuramoyl-L-alanyl-D-glutamate--2,6-diaminopimelate ligase [Roseimicrobium sp.]